MKPTPGDPRSSGLVSYPLKRLPAAPANSAISQVKVHWFFYQVLRHSVTHICCTKSVTVGTPANAIFITHTDAPCVVFLLMIRYVIMFLLAFYPSAPFPTFCSEISIAVIFFPSNAPIVRCVPIEGLTLQAHSAAIVSRQGPFTHSSPILALIGKFHSPTLAGVEISMQSPAL